MENLILVAVVGLVLIVGMGGVIYLHVSFMKRMSSDMRTIAMFRKARTLDDIAAMKAMGISAEEWDKDEKDEDKIPEDDGLRSPDELSPEALQAIAESDGS